MTHKHAKHPEQSLRVFQRHELITDGRTAELNRKPLVEHKDVPAHLNLDPEKVALGNLVAGVMIPTKEDVVEAMEQRDKRSARVKDATIYVFDDGEPTGRHAAPNQPRYTIMGPHAVDQIAAEIESGKGYKARHTASPENYTGKHAGGRMASLLGKLRILGRRHVPNEAPQAPRHRAPIVQLGKGESLAIGRDHWLPAAGLDVVSRDSELQEHYERTGRHQGDFVVDRDGNFSYKDLGRNGTTLYYRERTPNEEERLEERRRAHRERLASMERGRRQLAAEQSPPPYPPVADVYVGDAIAESHAEQGPPTEYLTIEDQPTEQHRMARPRQ